MADTRLTWTIFRANLQDLETTLNQVSDDNFEVFSVQLQESEWIVIARKGAREDSGKKAFGFGPVR